MNLATSAVDNRPEDCINILLVDDRPDKLLALESVLADLGANLVKASSGREALRLLLKQEFAVLLLDVSMPDMDGFETAALIRQRSNTEHTPIIFITSINTNETHVSQGYQLGAVDYIFSPIVPEMLRAKVSVFIDLYKKTQLIRKQSEWLFKEAARRADELETRLRSVLNRLNVGLFRASEDNVLLEANPAFLRLLKVSSVEEAAQLDTTRVLIESLAQDREVSADAGSSATDLKLVDADGCVSWVALTGISSQSPDGSRCIDGIVESITHRKQAEEQLNSLNEELELRVKERTEELSRSQDSLRRSEKLAALGTLAAGIAHEINNPLNSILVTAEYALKKGATHNQEETLRTIASETRRCGKIIRGVLQFSRNENTEKTLHDLNRVIRHSLDLVKNYVSQVPLIKSNLSDTPLPVVLNPTEIEQVLVNLIQNSVEANSKRACITVVTEQRGDRAILRVEDDGPGISKDIKDKIFDPFFSTRTNKGGTGLGLSVTHAIIVSHGGSVRLEQSKSGGALFIIDFPLGTSTTSTEQLSNSGAETKEELML